MSNLPPMHQVLLLEDETNAISFGRINRELFLQKFSGFAYEFWSETRIVALLDDYFVKDIKKAFFEFIPYAFRADLALCR